LFIPLSEGNTAVEVALAIASVVYGGLLGMFVLAIRSQKADQRSAIAGMIAGISVVAAIWVFARAEVAWPWFVPIGTAVTVAVGWVLGRNRTVA
jgi:Na+/proline symporter